ncbi:MAG: transposase [Pyrinomonadaceae bacterium]|nr:transposase [Pyrinomonadaceae bacterium]
MKPASVCCRLCGGGLRDSRIQPIKRAEYCFENFYVYGLTEILSGEKFFWELPSVNGKCFKLFLREFLPTSNKNTLHLIFLDNASFHSGKSLEAIAKVVLINFPASAPKLNPTERFWRDLKDWLAGKEMRSLRELSDLMMEKLRNYSEEKIKSLTGYQYLVTAYQEAIA